MKVANPLGPLVLMFVVSCLAAGSIFSMSSTHSARHNAESASQGHKLDEMCAKQYERFKTPVQCIGYVKSFDLPLPPQG